MEPIKLKGKGRYKLVRERDGRGDSGSMLVAVDPVTGKETGRNGEIAVGYAVKCGSFFPSTFGSDWWMTTAIEEILEKSDTKVKFKTVNGSIYTVSTR